MNIVHMYRYIELTLVQIKGLKVDARKLFGSDETGNAIFLASEAALREVTHTRTHTLSHTHRHPHTRTHILA